MKEASRIVLDGFELGSDVKEFRYPERYMDKRGAVMWNTVMNLIGGPVAAVTCGGKTHHLRLAAAPVHSLYMSTAYTSDLHVPVRRLQLDRASGALAAAPRKELFLRGPVPLEWLGKAAALPGKTLNVAIALWWRHGMAKGKPFKLTRRR